MKKMNAFSSIFESTRAPTKYHKLNKTRNKTEELSFPLKNRCKFRLWPPNQS